MTSNLEWLSLLTICIISLSRTEVSPNVIQLSGRSYILQIGQVPKGKEGDVEEGKEQVVRVNQNMMQLGGFHSLNMEV